METERYEASGQVNSMRDKTTSKKSRSHFNIDLSIVSILQNARAGMEILDDDTVVFQDVPTGEGFFNKEKTNILIKRPRPGLPFIIFVDDNLEYTGSDPGVARVFASGHKRSNWRALEINSGETDFQRTVQRAIAIVGADGGDPRIENKIAGSTGSSTGLLDTFGYNLLEEVENSPPTPCCKRMEKAVSEVVSCILRWGQSRLPVVCGESGVGKSFLMRHIALKFRETNPSLKPILVEVSRLFSGTLFGCDREQIFEKVLEEVVRSENTALFIEDIDIAVTETHAGRNLLAGFLDRGAKIIGTCRPRHLNKLHQAPLRRRIQVINIDETTPAETIFALDNLREKISSHHGINIDETFPALCVKYAKDLPGRFPAKAIDLMDASASRARISGARVIGMDDLLNAVAIAQKRLEVGS